MKKENVRVTTSGLRYEVPTLKIEIDSWISIKDRLPIDGDVIIYSAGSTIQSCVGRYCGGEDPMPSTPNWLPWNMVTHWMKLPEIEKESEDIQTLGVECMSNMYPKQDLDKLHDDIMDLIENRIFV